MLNHQSFQKKRQKAPWKDGCFLTPLIGPSSYREPPRSVGAAVRQENMGKPQVYRKELQRLFLRFGLKLTGAGRVGNPRDAPHVGLAQNRTQAKCVWCQARVFSLKARLLGTLRIQRETNDAVAFLRGTQIGLNSRSQTETFLDLGIVVEHPPRMVDMNSQGKDVSRVPKDVQSVPALCWIAPDPEGCAELLQKPSRPKE